LEMHLTVRSFERPALCNASDPFQSMSSPPFAVPQKCRDCKTTAIAMSTEKFRSSVLLAEELQAPELKLPVHGMAMLPPGVIAPEPQTLRYTSTTKLYGISGSDEPAEVEHDGFDLQELLKRIPISGVPPGIAEYSITVEKNIRSSDELVTASQQMSAFVRDLDKFWVYAAGEPLNPVVRRLSMEHSIAGWSHNEGEIRDYLVRNCRQVFAVVDSPGLRHWICMPWFPLVPALQARAAYHAALAAVQALVDLHYAALKSTQFEGRLFGLAKALELAREILPGKTDDARQGVFDIHVKDNLRHSLHWLMDMANNRYHTRHAVQKGSTVQLKPKMTGGEISDFEHDADLIVRATICRGLSIPCVTFEKRKRE
jgi:hypothetical protein